jgi:glycerol-3-phosphate dehydrogenase
MNQRPFSPEVRADNLDRMAGRSRAAPPLDLLVIGGGITGAGIVRDAAQRGLRAGLVERRDFAAGTSSRSSKLIHGGVRYLQLGDFGLVRESAFERRVLGQIAPHLVHPILTVVPARSRRAQLALNLGLWTYERLGGVDASQRHTMWDRETTLARVPQLRRPRLYGAVAYYESLTDDARLVLDTLKDAHAAGALIANYAEVTALHPEGQRVAGARVHDAIGGRDVDIAARVVVNAAGPWVDAVRRLEGPLPSKRLHLTKGIHLTLPRECLPLDYLVVFTARDRRSVFAVPRGTVVYVGTTDTNYGAPTDHPKITIDDVNYLLSAVERSFVTKRVGPEAVLSAWAGLRPLLHEEGKAPSEISRKDEIMVGLTGLISIAGGKLTTYRRMAARTVDLVLQSLEHINGVAASVGPSRTDRLPLAGGDRSRKELAVLERQLAERYPDVLPRTIERLAARYGTQVESVLGAIGEDPDLAQPVVNDGPLLRAEVHYAIENEMALGVEDVLDRRTRLLPFAPDQGLAVLDAAATTLARRLDWTEEHTAAETAAYRALAATLRFPRGQNAAAPPDTAAPRAIAAGKG